MLTILLYTLISAFSFMVLLSQNGSLHGITLPETSLHANVKKTQLSSVVLIAALFTLFNIYITQIEGFMHSDRLVYMRYFESQTSTSSRGLDFVFALARMVSNDVVLVFYLATFFVVFFLLRAYRISTDASPASVGLILMSSYIVTTVGHLKQSYANALASLLLILAIQSTGKREKYICWILIVIACIFHPVGFLLIPAYFLVKIPNPGRYRWGLAVMLIFLIMFSNYIAKLILPLLEMISPLLTRKTVQYFSGRSAFSRIISGTVLSAFVKGFPFYYITFIGFIYRKRFSHMISFFDKYLLISIYSSCLFFSSAFFYWMQRSVLLFYFPVYVFFTLIVNNIKKPEVRFLHWTIVGGSTAFMFYRYMFQVFVMDSLNSGVTPW